MHIPFHGRPGLPNVVGSKGCARIRAYVWGQFREDRLGVEARTQLAIGTCEEHVYGMGSRTRCGVVTVYLWDAGTWCGVSGTLEDAQQHVADRMRDEGRIEAAWVVLGVFSLSRCYERTGQAWTAYRRPGGTVFWAPIGREGLRVVS